MAGMNRRAMMLAAAGYVAVRVALAAAADIPHHPDSDSYRVAPNLIGGAWRPWVYPAVRWVLDDRAVVIFQALASGVAFCFLAFALRQQMHNPVVAKAGAGVILLIGLTDRVTFWDAAMLSESLAISLTVTLIACIALRDSTPWWATSAVFALWLFVRDAHLFVGALVLGGVAARAIVRRSGPQLPIAMCLALLWAGAAARNNDDVEHYNLNLNIAHHVGSDVDTFRWFLDRGMPPSNAFFDPDVETRHELLMMDTDFQRWLTTSSESVYAEYLLRHPSFLLMDPLEAMFVEGPAGRQAMVDHSRLTNANPPLGIPFLWPHEAQVFTLVLLIAGVAAGLDFYRRSPDRTREIFPALIVASTLPHAILVYHGSPWDVARHAVVLSLSLVLGCCWLILLDIDASTSRRGHHPVTGTTVGHGDEQTQLLGPTHVLPDVRGSGGPRSPVDAVR